MNEETLFNLALEKPPHERSGFLDSACGGNAELRGRVERLLSAHDNPGSFLQQPALQSTGASPSEATQALDAVAANCAGGTRTQAEPTKSATDDLAFLTPSTRPDSHGRLEHYEILEVIGKGGFGTVLKAFDEKLHRMVAIKVLSLELSASGTARQRFIREARTAAAVAHEHVVTIHAVGEEHRPPYLVMQLIDGATLQQKLDKSGTLGLREILRIGLQMAQALDAAHKQGLVHRDIKPSNILLENGVERVKITDFGLARAVDDASVTQSGTVAGTPMYMSPEQAEGLQIDHRSDLFSLGTVLYAMCTGHPPFRASGTHAVLKRVIDALPRPIREINNEIPDWLCDIIARLHAKKPEDRFQTAKEVAELLGQHLAHLQQPTLVARPTTSVPPSSAQPQAAVARTRQRRVAAVAFAVMGVFVSFAALMLFNLPTERVSPPGVQWLIAGLGLASLLAAVWLAFDSRRRFYAAACALVVLGVVLSALETTDVTHFFHAPIYWVDLNVDDPNVAFKIVPVVDGADPEATILAHAVRIEWKGKKKLALAPGQYWFAAILDDRLVYFETVDVDKPRAVTISWAAEFTKREKQKLQGAWHPVSGEYDGNALTADMIAAVNFGLRFQGDHAIVRLSQSKHLKATEYNAAFKIDPRKRLATLDLIDAIDGKTMFCIYRFTSDTLQLCGSFLKRPTEFSTKQGSDEDRMLFVLERGYLAPAKPSVEPGWVQLFNNKDGKGWEDLKGWETIAGGTGRWKVVDGSLTCDGPGSYLFTKRDDYKDFHFRVEARLNAKGKLQNHSGQCFRCRFEIGWPNGYYAAIAHSNPDAAGMAHTGDLIRSRPTGEGDTLVKVAGGLVVDDAWFTQEVIAKGNHIQILVNGKKVADYIDKDSVFLQGRLALVHLAEPTRIEFRKVEIKELPPEEPGWVQLFNGKDLSGWVPRMFDKNTRPNQAWEVYDGILFSRSAPSGYLRSEKPYEHFILEMDIQASDTFEVGQRTWAGDLFFQMAVPDPGFFQPSGIRLQITPGGKGSIHLTGAKGPATPVDWSRFETGWNRLRVEAHPGSLTFFLNGERVFSKTDYESRPGYLGIFSVGVGARYRNIRIKELPPDEPSPQFAIAATPRLLKTIDNKSTVRALAFTAEGDTLIAGGDHLTFFDRAKGDVLHQEKLPSQITCPFSLSQDRKTLALVYKDAALVLDLPIRKIPLQANRGLTFSAALSPDGKTLVYADEKMLWFHDRATGKTEEEARHGNLMGLKYSPDGRFLIGTNAKELMILDAKIRDVVAKKAIGPGFGAGVEISQDSKRLVTTGVSGGKSAFYVFSLPDHELQYLEKNLAKAPFSMALSPDGNYLALGLMGGTVQIWDLAHKKAVASWTVAKVLPSAVAFSPDGKTLATGSGNFIEVWDLTPQEPGWVQLFNGKDLTGWFAGEGKFDVEDGNLVGRKASYLMSVRDDYTHYHLRIEAKIDKDCHGDLLFGHANDGQGLVGYRSAIHPNWTSKSGTLLLYSAKRRDGVALQEVTDELIEPEKWFTHEVIARGSHIIARINGKTVVDKSDAPSAKGRVGILSNRPVGTIWVKKFEIKELSPK